MKRTMQTENLTCISLKQKNVDEVSIFFYLDEDIHRNRLSHYENMSMQYIAIFHCCKNGRFQMKNVIFF